MREPLATAEPGRVAEAVSGEYPAAASTYSAPSYAEDPQSWWHDDPPEPLAGLGLLRLALWLLLIPLLERIPALMNRTTRK